MMFVRPLRTLGVVLVLVAGLGFYQWLQGQEAAPPAPTAEVPPPEPKGVEVMARGPIHEAFASPTAEPTPTKSVPKQPPKPINEMPPEEKPAGNVVWIGGYWGWDDDRNDFLWVSGIWRTVPPGKQWVAGYWREDNDQWQWVGGFWTEAAAEDGAARDVTYLPKPPEPPPVTPPGEPPTPESFYVPGQYVWTGTAYGWRAGYWARVQPGYVWVPAHFRWTPGGYIYVAGYWDLAISRRGFLYAPVVVDYAVVGPTFVYTPTYAVADSVVLDAMFIRPCTCHYYFGDYYGVRYRDYGFESCVVYSRRNYDAIIVYERYERRSDPTWIDIQINLCSRRDRGEEPCPPRTLAQQNIIQQNIIQQNTVVNNTVINNVNTTSVNNTNINNTRVNNTVANNKAVYNNTLLMPASRLAQQKNIQVVKLDAATRNQALVSSRAVQQVAAQRSKTEVTSPGIPTRPRTAPLSLPKVQPVRAATEPKMVVPERRVNPQNQHNAVQAPHTGNPPNRNGPPANNSNGGPRTTTPPPRTGTPANRGGYQPPQNPNAPNRGVNPPPRTGNPPWNGNPAQQRYVPPQQRSVSPPVRPVQPPARPVPPPRRQEPPRKNPPDDKQHPPNG